MIQRHSKSIDEIKREHPLEYPINQGRSTPRPISVAEPTRVILFFVNLQLIF